MRTHGYSVRGAIAKTNRYFFHKGNAHSVMGPFVLDGGFLDISTIEGGYDADTFWLAINQKVVRRGAPSLPVPPLPFRSRSESLRAFRPGASRAPPPSSRTCGRILSPIAYL